MSQKVTSLAPKATEDPLRSSRPLLHHLDYFCGFYHQRSFSAFGHPSNTKRDGEVFKSQMRPFHESTMYAVTGWWDMSSGIFQTKKSIVKIRVPLDEGEVWLHMRQSLLRERFGRLEYFRFPWSSAMMFCVSLSSEQFFCFLCYCPPHLLKRHTNKSSCLRTLFGSHTRRWTDSLTGLSIPWTTRSGTCHSSGSTETGIRYSIELSPNGRYLSFLDDWGFISNLGRVRNPCERVLLKTRAAHKYQCGILMSERYEGPFSHPWADCIFLVSQTDIQLWGIQER